MNEVPDSSLGGLGVLTQHPPSASQNHLSMHSEPTLPFPQWLRIMRKLFQNYKDSKINLLLSESQILSIYLYLYFMPYIYGIHIRRKKKNLSFYEFNSKTPKKLLMCLSRGFQFCLRSPGVAHRLLPISCPPFGIPCGISYSSECLCQVPELLFSLFWDTVSPQGQFVMRQQSLQKVFFSCLVHTGNQSSENKTLQRQDKSMRTAQSSFPLWLAAWGADKAFKQQVSEEKLLGLDVRS